MNYLILIIILLHLHIGNVPTYFQVGITLKNTKKLSTNKNKYFLIWKQP